MSELCVGVFPGMLRCIDFTLRACQKLLTYWTHLVVAYSLRGTFIGASLRIHYLYSILYLFLVQIYESCW